MPSTTPGESVRAKSDAEEGQVGADDGRQMGDVDAELRVPAQVPLVELREIDAAAGSYGVPPRVRRRDGRPRYGRASAPRAGSNRYNGRCRTSNDGVANRAPTSSARDRQRRRQLEHVRLVLAEADQHRETSGREACRAGRANAPACAASAAGARAGRARWRSACRSRGRRARPCSSARPFGEPRAEQLARSRDLLGQLHLLGAIEHIDQRLVAELVDRAAVAAPSAKPGRAFSSCACTAAE